MNVHIVPCYEWPKSDKSGTTDVFRFICDTLVLGSQVAGGLAV